MAGAGTDSLFVGQIRDCYDIQDCYNDNADCCVVFHRVSFWEKTWD